MESKNENVKKPSISMSKTGLEITSFDSLYRFSELLAKSDFLPRSYGDRLEKRTANAMISIQFGAEIGLSPTQSIQNIAVVNGMPSIWGDAALSLVRSSNRLKFFKEYYEGKEGSDEFCAVCEIQRVGEDEITIERFGVKDAKTARLWGKNGTWSTHPKRMLRYKARAFALRDKFPDILKGLRLNEEMQGVLIDVTPNKESVINNVSIDDNKEELNVYKHRCMSNTDKETIKDDLNQIISDASSKLSDSDNQILKEFATKHMMETLGNKGVDNV